VPRELLGEKLGGGDGNQAGSSREGRPADGREIMPSCVRTAR
jgi:hypothetical protein